MSPTGETSSPHPFGAFLVQVERAVGAVIGTKAIGAGDLAHAPDADWVDNAAAAIRSAADRCARGERAAALVLDVDVSDCLAEIQRAVSARIPVAVHVLETASGATFGLPALLDAGVMVIGARRPSELVELVLAGRRAAEDAETPSVQWVGRPAEPPSDAALGELAPPALAVVQRFLGTPRAASTISDRTSAAARTPFALGSALREVTVATGGEPLGAIEKHSTADATDLLVAFGATIPAALEASRQAREAGRKVGVVGLRVLRPLAAPELVKACGRSTGITVLEPHAPLMGAPGRLATDLKGAFADALTWASGFPGVGRIPTVVSATTDGQWTVERVARSLAELAQGDRATRRFHVAD